MYFLGIDLGSSSIKLSLLDGESNKTLQDVTVPKHEMKIHAPKHGWAEQDPKQWWENVKQGVAELKNNTDVDFQLVKGIGIAYQMHGLVVVDKNLEPLRPSIIWCDSRAAEIGQQHYEAIGAETCQEQILGSPGNFTASKLKWVKENQPDVYAKIKYFMLPGDFIATKLTGVAQTSTSGLSEAALWNFKENRLATEILDAMEISTELVPEVVPNFAEQAKVDPSIAAELGISNQAIVSYRAGDQPNNAWSLNVSNPGEIATTAGTSAVIYGLSSLDDYDKNNRINTFLHVNNQEDHKRNGVMVCINGSGILYQWIRQLMSVDRDEPLNYETLNEFAKKSVPGSKGLRFYPFGNGVERIFNNKPAFSGVQNLNFNIHQTPEFVRAACEGIVFAMHYGFEIMREVGVEGKVVRAGNSNLFLNPAFREIFIHTTNTSLELYDTSGSEGAARGAAYGLGYYKSVEETFKGLVCIERFDPDPELVQKYKEIYQNWKNNI
ncbi:xylulose kinase [Galbibacter marinus]|uniref:Xylulose kinase n=1 Tax=Galbibacter marinus TaxID=555500 RepID=K2Q6I1_9FLAO|nr:FGGY family carbohydrate kinase [Galbibacter marinus]EKF56476.1 xylulose kinase [Galbibacter marinus]